MHLSNPQLLALKAYILTVPAWAAKPIDSQGALDIAAELNKAETPDYIVWRTNVGADEIGNAWVGTDIDSMGALNMQRLQLLLQSSRSGVFDFSRVDRRAGFENPFGSNAANASRVAMRAVWKRQALVIEKLFAVGLGSAASPSSMAVEGHIGYDDVQAARSM